MPKSVNGTGTMYYGNALSLPDNSYVVTEWVTLLGLPLIPIGSKRVWYQGHDKQPWWSNQSVGHYKTVRVPLHIPQVLKGYAITLAIIGGVVLADYFMYGVFP